MQLSTAQVQKVLTSPQNLQFSQLSLNLMMTRLKGKYAGQPSSATLSSCAKEINDMLTKFGSIMQKDFEMMTKM